MLVSRLLNSDDESILQLNRIVSMSNESGCLSRFSGRTNGHQIMRSRKLLFSFFYFIQVGDYAILMKVVCFIDGNMCVLNWQIVKISLNLPQLCIHRQSIPRKEEIESIDSISVAKKSSASVCMRLMKVDFVLDVSELFRLDCKSASTDELLFPMKIVNHVNISVSDYEHQKPLNSNCWQSFYSPNVADLRVRLTQLWMFWPQLTKLHVYFENQLV